jgi:hypothetical protein
VGIFGMTHEQLLKSEWVVDGALTAKFELEVPIGWASQSDTYV